VQTSTTDTLDVTVRATEAYDLSWLLLWSVAENVTSAAGARTREKPTLLRLPDRRDLYPVGGIRLRLADGTLLAPTAVDVRTSGTLDGLQRVVTTSLTSGYDRRVSLWVATLTRDGIPSRVVGPAAALTGPRPLVVPALGVVTTADGDVATWPVPVVAAEIALERSLDNGDTWVRVSPWMPPTATTFSLPPAGTRVYRLVLRGGGQTVPGPAVTPA
jgi:hypothetical protein